MRMNINHAKKAGVTIHEYCPLTNRDPDIEAAFDRVTHEWLGQKKSSLLAFTMGKAGLENPMDKRYFYAKNAEGTIVAFIAFVPFLGKDGYMADVTRHGSNAPGGVMETIIYEAFQTFRSEGVHYGSLGVAPLAGLDDEKASLVERLLRFVYNNLNENDPMPYSYGSTLSVREFRGSSNARVLWTTTRAMEAWNLTRRRYGAGIPVGYAFKRIWEGGHGTASQHYAGVAFDVGQGTSRAIRQRIHAAATATRAWGYVEPLSMTPTWVHFDRRYGTPACSGTTSGYPTCRRGDKNTYVLILQDALNALGYSTKTLDGAFGQNTYAALRAAQRSFSLTADGVCGCNTWKKLTSAVVGIGRTKTVID